MFPPHTKLEQAVKFSRFDKDSPFATVSEHPFLLDDIEWKTAEHYYQACKFKGRSYASEIMLSADGQQAYDMGNRWLKRKVRHWKSNRQLYMTRALFRKVKEYTEVEAALLATGSADLIEISQYDYYWGIGRDQRGENMLGKVWMNIRHKLLNEKS